MAAEAHRQRPAPDDAVGVQVGGRDHPARLPQVRDDRPPELAVVERPRAAGGDPLERVAEVGKAEPVACPALRVHAAALGRVPEDDVEDRVQVRLLTRQLEAVVSELDRRRDEPRPGQRSEGPMGFLEARSVPRDGARGRADVEDLRRLAVEVDVDRFHLGGPARPPEPRRGDEEVQQPRRPVARAVDEHEAAPARARQRALDHPGGEAGRDAGVDRVPALGEHGGADLGGQRVPGGDRPAHAEQDL